MCGMGGKRIEKGNSHFITTIWSLVKSLYSGLPFAPILVKTSLVSSDRNQNKLKEKEVFWLAHLGSLGRSWLHPE